MSELEPEPLEMACPTNCPNRRGDGLKIFGLYIDPVEICLHACVVLVLGIPAVKASVRENFAAVDGLQWLGAIAVMSGVVRLAPTERINAYARLR